VTIVAHSMGGLLGKYALAKIETDTTNPYHRLIADKRIDDFIMVATPQWGTPETIGALLHGERLNKSIPHIYDFLSKVTGRQWAQRMTSAYTLLPSDAYFDHVTSVYPDGWTDKSPRPVSFDTTLATLSDPYILYSALHAMFGDAIDTYAKLAAFLRGDEGRPLPPVDDLTHPIRLTNDMLAYGTVVHALTDTWLSPDVDHDGTPDIRVVQIAGWGIPDTIANISYHAIEKSDVVCGTMPYNRYDCKKTNTRVEFVPEPVGFVA